MKQGMGKKTFNIQHSAPSFQGERQNRRWHYSTTITGADAIKHPRRDPTSLSSLPDPKLRRKDDRLELLPGKFPCSRLDDGFGSSPCGEGGFQQMPGGFELALRLQPVLKVASGRTTIRLPVQIGQMRDFTVTEFRPGRHGVTSRESFGLCARRVAMFHSLIPQ